MNKTAVDNVVMGIVGIVCESALVDNNRRVIDTAVGDFQAGQPPVIATMNATDCRYIISNKSGHRRDMERRIDAAPGSRQPSKIGCLDGCHKWATRKRAQPKRVPHIPLLIDRPCL